MLFISFTFCENRFCEILLKSNSKYCWISSRHKLGFVCRGQIAEEFMRKCQTLVGDQLVYAASVNNGSVGERGCLNYEYMKHFFLWLCNLRNNL